MMTERMSRNDMLMEIAFTVAKRGTCSRLKVGAVFSRDGRIIAMGYNGAPAGLPHCVHPVKPKLDVFGTEGIQLVSLNEQGRVIAYPEKGCEIAEHAERNAIAFAAKHGLALEGSDLHCTDAPCLACARTIINAGIKRVFYTRPYRITDGVDLLKEAGLDVIDMVAWV